MALIDQFIHLLMSVVLIFGVYQFYFWCQRQRWVPARRLPTWVDDAVPYWPAWVWIYSLLYYPAIVYLPWTCTSSQHFNRMVMSFLALLAMQMVFFLLLPVETPPQWRELNTGRTLSERFLRFVHRFDGSTNCFPSMHVSVATLVALHAEARVGAWGYGFPVLIALSCAFTKQHYLVDLPAGALLGVLAFRFYRWMA